MRLPLLTVANGLLLASLAIFSHFVGATYGESAPEPPPLVVKKVPEKDRAQLQVIDGVPVLRLSGTPREMGRVHGRVFREQVRFLVKEYYEAFVLKMVGAEAMAAWQKAAQPYIPPKYIEEMRGLAEGSGVPFDTIVRVNCMVDRLQMVMCSTVVAGGEATKTGEVYFGRNLDFPGRNILHKSTVVLVFEGDGKGESVAAITWPGLIGLLSGMNESGVCGATMMIHRGGDAKPGMPYMLMYRAALEAATQTSDVAKVFAKTPRTIANNFMVVDAGGEAEVVEYDALKLARRPAKRGTACSTNHFRSKELASTGWRLGVGRYKTLDEFLRKEHGKITIGGVRKALRDTATPFYLNVQSMIFLPAKRVLHLSIGGKLPAADQKFVAISRKQLFGSSLTASD